MQVRTGGADRDGPASSGRRVVASDRAGDGVFADHGQDAGRSVGAGRRSGAGGLQLLGAAAAGPAFVSVAADRGAGTAGARGAGADELGTDAPDGADGAASLDDLQGPQASWPLAAAPLDAADVSAL